jgi:hypothetical protein
MSKHKYWTDFTYLFRTHKPNRDPLPDPTPKSDPAILERRRKLEELQELRDLRRQLADVWD